MCLFPSIPINNPFTAPTQMQTVTKKELEFKDGTNLTFFLSMYKPLNIYINIYKHKYMSTFKQKALEN